MRLTDFDQRLADLGARPSQRFARVILPLSMPGVLSAALVVFVPTVGDYVTPALVGGPSSTLIGSLIQAQFGKANDWPAGSAMSVATIMAVALPLAAIYALHQQIKKRAEAAAA